MEKKAELEAEGATSAGPPLPAKLIKMILGSISDPNSENARMMAQKL